MQSERLYYLLEDHLKATRAPGVDFLALELEELLRENEYVRVVESEEFHQRDAVLQLCVKPLEPDSKVFVIGLVGEHLDGRFVQVVLDLFPVVGREQGV